MALLSGVGVYLAGSYIITSEIVLHYYCTARKNLYMNCGLTSTRFAFPKLWIPSQYCIQASNYIHFHVDKTCDYSL